MTRSSNLIVKRKRPVIGGLKADVHAISSARSARSMTTPLSFLESGRPLLESPIFRPNNQIDAGHPLYKLDPQPQIEYDGTRIPAVLCDSEGNVRTTQIGTKTFPYRVVLLASTNGNDRVYNPQKHDKYS